MSSTEEAGQKIAQRLGQGVTYKGPWLPYGPKGEFLGYFFQDDAVTETSFVAKTFEEAKASLIKTRKDFGAKPPVFDNNPGNTLITTEEWDQAFLRALPVVSAGIGVLSAIMGIMALRSSSLAQRVSYEDGQYLVSVRYPGQWRDIREFVTPDAPGVQQIYQDTGPDAWALYDWVAQNISYRLDIGEFFQFPRETIARIQGDCEDTSILLTSLLRNFTDAYVALGTLRGLGHAWVAHEGEILETTYTSARPVPDPENYVAFVLFDEREVIELWPGALDEVFAVARDEELKLSLMARMLEAVA